MKRIILLTAFLALFSMVEAQTPLKGKVVEKDSGKPIPGASISVGNQSALSSDNGDFEVTILTTNQLIEITSISHLPFRDSLSKFGVIRGGAFVTVSDLTFQLARKGLFLSPVEVLATRAGYRAPFTKSNLGKEDIEKLNLGQDLPFLINQTPSVVINSDAGNGVGYTGLRIRGSDLSRINVTLNGIPYNDAESQGVFFVDLPDFSSSVNSIQIQRGVGTSSNGAGAFGATINISTHEFNDKPYAEINNSYGSFNTWKNTVKAGSGLLGDHFTIDARLSRISSDGYIDRAESKLSSFYLSGAYFSEKTQLRLNVFGGDERTYQAWYGVPESMLKTNRTFNSAGTEKPGDPYENETDNFRQDHYQFFLNHALNDVLSFNTSVFYTKGKGYYEQYKAEEDFNDYGLPNPVIGNETIENTDLIRQLWLDNDFYGSVLSLQYNKNGTQLTLGGGWNRYEGDHFGKVIWSQFGFPLNHRWYSLDAVKRDVNIYGKWQQRLSNRFQTFADLQYRAVKYDINGFRNNPALKIYNDYGFINPKAGLSYAVPGLQAYISYALANKEPNRDDFEAGQEQQPLHETLHNIELGVEKKTQVFTIGATAYYMYYRNQLVLTGKINDVGAYTRTNIPESYRLGLELQGSVRPLKQLMVDISLALSRNKINNFVEYVDDYDNGGQKTFFYDKPDIAFSPWLVGNATITYKPVQNGEISLFSKYVSDQYLDNTGNKTRQLKAFFVNDLRARYSFKSRLFKEITLTGQLNNLFDVKYEPNGYTFSYLYGNELTTENFYYPMAGRNFMVGVVVKIGGSN
ncbi:MAG TPA: TonB-dependent receptor plug domain-containing protein [Chitinophagaceae bacterium]